MLFVIEGINYSNTDVYYYSPEEFDLYEQDNPGRDKEYYVNLHGPAHAHGGKQMIAGGEIATSLSDVFKHDSINIYVLADTLVNKYGVEELGDTVKLCEVKEPKSCMYFYEDMDWCSMLGRHV